MVKPVYAILDNEGNIVEMVHPFPDGSYPRGAVFLHDAHLDNLREAKWEEVKHLRQRIEHGGATTPLGRMDSDPESQRKVSGLVTMAMLAQANSLPFLQPFTMQDNSVVEHDAAAMIAAGVAMGQHVSACHAASRELRDALDAATTVQEVENLDPTSANWPS